MFKLDLEKAEEPDIKLPTSVGSSKKQGDFQKNIYFCFIDYAKTFDCVDHNNLWKILKEIGIADHLTCLLRNLYAGQEATVRTWHGTTDWFQIGKGARQGCILSPCLFNFYAGFSSVQFSLSVMSDSLWTHESQHTRTPCPSPTPGVHSDSGPSSQWCHPGISSSAVPFSFCPQTLPGSESFPMSQLFAWGGQSTGVSALELFPPKKSQGWSPLEWTGWISLQSKGLSRVFSNTTVQTHQFFNAQPSSQSNSHIHTWPLEKP